MVILPAYYAASLNADQEQVIQYYVDICDASPVRRGLISALSRGFLQIQSQPKSTLWLPDAEISYLQNLLRIILVLQVQDSREEGITVFPSTALHANSLTINRSHYCCIISLPTLVAKTCHPL
jgi:hypothetical protein